MFVTRSFCDSYKRLMRCLFRPPRFGRIASCKDCNDLATSCGAVDCYENNLADDRMFFVSVAHPSGADKGGQGCITTRRSQRTGGAAGTTGSTLSCDSILTLVLQLTLCEAVRGTLAALFGCIVYNVHYRMY